MNGVGNSLLGLFNNFYSLSIFGFFIFGGAGHFNGGMNAVKSIYGGGI